jgi:hypothetical protein
LSTILAELKEKAAQLPDHERAELALALIESLDAPARVIHYSFHPDAEAELAIAMG